MDASPALIAAMKASLATPAHGWAVTSRVETTSGGNPQVVVSLRASGRSMAVGSVVPMQASYMAGLGDSAWVALGGQLIVNGLMLATTDIELRNAVLALATSWAAAQQTAITAALEAP